MVSSVIYTGLGFILLVSEFTFGLSKILRIDTLKNYYDNSNYLNLQNYNNDYAGNVPNYNSVNKKIMHNSQESRYPNPTFKEWQDIKITKAYPRKQKRSKIKKPKCYTWTSPEGIQFKLNPMLSRSGQFLGRTKTPPAFHSNSISCRNDYNEFSQPYYSPGSVSDLVTLKY